MNDENKLRRYLKTFSVILFSAYCIFILWFTIFSRSPLTTRHTVLSLFWSYRAWLAGEPNGKTEAIQNFNNILFFIPYGFLFPLKKKGWKTIALYAALFSLLIEVTQYLFILGWAEVDDVVCNTLGAIIGYFIWLGLHKGITAILHKTET